MLPRLPVLRLLLALALGAVTIAHAAGSVHRIETRPGVFTAVYWESAAQPRATVLLLPGGEGGFGKVEDGRPTSPNFLVRSVPHFLARGLNVAIFGRPSDSDGLGYADRIAPAHLEDLRVVLEFARQRGTEPVWLVGTSRGTVSATAAALRWPALAQGLVLSASVVDRRKPGAVTTQDLGAIRMPVLVLHHARDACGACRPQAVPEIVSSLTQSRVRKLVMLDGGAEPRGDPCTALHWHGFVGLESQAVDIIADWIVDPRP
ncbi:MAG: alpha/beta hydrolase [Piscinibacter sp.]|uniref:alpha/beta hydrolase n=1 Tax=Piscinibacter sp. TaxID=1903157 RepID=UPI003D0A4137